MARICMWIVAGIMLAMAAPSGAQNVRLKDIGHFQGWRDNHLIGYGVVTGLAGSGDSPRSDMTRQALQNILSRMGLSISADQIQSRNVAVVMVTATLPPSANVGDRIDATVTSIGDARSLAGGTLLMTPLNGPNKLSYALAQGALVVGGDRFEAEGNLRQRNYPTSAVVSNGALVEVSVEADVQNGTANTITYVLRAPDFTMAKSVEDAINQSLGFGSAQMIGADAIRIRNDNRMGNVNRLLAEIENIRVMPEQVARVVVNERTGTVVAGGDAQISSVAIAQGDIKVSVDIDNQASNSSIYGGYVRDARGIIVSNARLDVRQDKVEVFRFPGTSVADLVQGLARAKVSTRDMIAILEAMKTAGALHADIVVQ